MDVDGTLTDGRVYVGEGGELFKAFDIKDGLGIHDILPALGIVPVIITLIGVCLLRIIWLAGVMEISPTIHAIIFSYPVTWTITALAFTGYYLWMDRRRGQNPDGTVR